MMQDMENNPLTAGRIIGSDFSENILIQGDNKVALKKLQAGFAGRIKCIYIDPPYNNGE